MNQGGQPYCSKLLDIAKDEEEWSVLISCVMLKVTHMVSELGGEGEDDEEEDNETQLVDHFYSEEDEVKVFFEKLDEELDKVNQFYKNKESEFLERGEMLNKQLQILLDLQQVLHNRRRSRSRLNSSGFLRSYSSSGRTSDSETPTEFAECIGEDTQTDDMISALERNGINLLGAATRGKTKKGKPKMAMRIDIPATTPTRTITAVTSMLWEDLVNNPKR